MMNPSISDVPDTGLHTCRKLVATLACRAKGTRLYGKPLQLLDIENGIALLDHIIDLCKRINAISAIVLGVSEGKENLPFFDVAERHGIQAVPGSEKDVLLRLIDCCKAAGGTDAFRITTECPFPLFEMIAPVWAAHMRDGNDVTVIDGLPEGCHFEIYTLRSLEQSHGLGDGRHRSEYCSLYIREHPGDFKIARLPVEESLLRTDLRLTVDYPEDLVLCRKVYEHLKKDAPLIKVRDIIRYLDEHPDVAAIVSPYVEPEMLWD